MLAAEVSHGLRNVDLAESGFGSNIEVDEGEGGAEVAEHIQTGSRNITVLATASVVQHVIPTHPNIRGYSAQEDCGSFDLDDDGSDDDFQEPELVEEWERRLNAIDCPEEEEIDSETDEYEGLNRR